MTQPPTQRQEDPGPQPSDPALAQPGPDLNLQALADKVYDLLKRELRLEYERRGPVKFR